MAHAFSVKSLRQQEETVHLYLDEFITQIGRLGSLDQGVDMTEAFNWLTFDIIGRYSELMLTRFFNGLWPCLLSLGYPTVETLTYFYLR